METISALLKFIPEPWRTLIFAIIMASPYLGRAIQSVRNGGGIKGIFSSIWLGTNVPKKVKEAINEKIKEETK